MRETFRYGISDMTDVRKIELIRRNSILDSIEPQYAGEMLRMWQFDDYRAQQRQIMIREGFTQEQIYKSLRWIGYDTTGMG